MRKYTTFYRLIITAESFRSGDTITLVDDYYTPGRIGLGDDYKKFCDASQMYIMCMNDTLKECGGEGELALSITTCCFNNGTGRSAKAQTNIDPYYMKDKGGIVQMRSITDDDTITEVLAEGLKWLKKQRTPF